MIWGFLPLSGARIKREFVQQTAEERCGIEFPSAWLGSLGIYSCFHVLHELPEFLIQSERSAFFWVIAGDHRCVLLADWKIGVSAEWSFSLLCIISWDTVKLGRSLLGSLGRSNSQEDFFCRLQEEQGNKKRRKAEKWHKMHFDSNTILR